MHLLQLHSNPWNCDCHLKNFRDWVVYRGLYTYPTSCQEPERLAGNKILVVTFHIQELNMKLIKKITIEDWQLLRHHSEAVNDVFVLHEFVFENIKVANRYEEKNDSVQ